jgi:hypothetical protein
MTVQLGAIAPLNLKKASLICEAGRLLRARLSRSDLNGNAYGAP